MIRYFDVDQSLVRWDWPSQPPQVWTGTQWVHFPGVQSILNDGVELTEAQAEARMRE